MVAKVKSTTKKSRSAPKPRLARLYKQAIKGVAGLGLATLLGWIGHALGWTQSMYNKVFRYPVEFTYVNQGETKTGYVLEFQVKSTSGEPVYIPRDDLKARIVKDDSLVAAMSPSDRNDLLHDETVKVLDNAATLNAEIDGRTYTANPTVTCTSQPRPLYLFLRVAGPGSTNPSLRLQIAPVYRSLAVSLRRRLYTSDYVEVPFRHVSIIAGNDKTRVIQK
jgi:hypothetical protein